MPQVLIASMRQCRVRTPPGREHFMPERCASCDSRVWAPVMAIEEAIRDGATYDILCDACTRDWLDKLKQDPARTSRVSFWSNSHEAPSVFGEITNFDDVLDLLDGTG